ncbi:MAG: hypothetical protein E7621_00905 [Ruminococcaceae bacterium]|nr:hypothetical protein [Oscillospiraceae bacterium]
MKKALDFIKNIFVSAALVNLATVVSVILVFLSVDTLETNAVMQLDLLIGSVVFSLICGFSLTVFKAIPKILPMLRYCLEYALCLFGLYVSLFCLTENVKNYTAFFALATAFTLIYLVVALCFWLVKKLYCGADKKKEKEYENIFDELKK